ncbi:MAG: phosphotransferase [Candidatus Roizmanbacteria bacterium]|nr:MAG: phosphotransferase [Candidatus Roizmanbacteria bacterium]
MANGDYCYNNLISDGKKITAVIDWGESRYGDFVLDLAWLDFWKSEVNYGDILKVGYKNKDKDFKNYEKRFRCYKIFIGITSIVIAAKHDDQKDYILVKNDIDLFI